MSSSSSSSRSPVGRTSSPSLCERDPCLLADSVAEIGGGARAKECYCARVSADLGIRDGVKGVLLGTCEFYSNTREAYGLVVVQLLV